MSAPLLHVEDLSKTYYPGGAKAGRGASGDHGIKALDGLSFDVAKGETFGLVGESGCGKSTAARCLLRLVEPTRGTVVMDGVDVRGQSADELRRLRRRMQIVFQDATASLNSRMTVRGIVEEPLKIHGVGDASARREAALQMLDVVGISERQAERKPHALSGGQRQRVGVARALVTQPDLVVLDEPISAVDVSVQAQILNLLSDLQERFELTYVFIVHDLAVAQYFCDRIAVLYLGRLVELADSRTLFADPQHPYTVSLLSAVPIPDPSVEARREHIILRGEAAVSAAPATGCAFQSRCPVGRDRPVCGEAVPPLEPTGSGHWTACHFPGELERALAEGRAID